MHELKERSRLVEQVRQYLEKQGQPRLAMLGILAVTLAAGFLASVAMVHLGVDRMSLRYPVAVGFAYATFLGLLWGWLRRHQTTTLASSEDREGLFFVSAAAVGIASMKGQNPDPDREKCRKDSNDFSGLVNLGGGGDGLGAVAILVLIAVICTLIVSVYLVVTSPALLAELLVDGALLARCPAQSTLINRLTGRKECYGGPGSRPQSRRSCSAWSDSAWSALRRARGHWAKHGPSNARIANPDVSTREADDTTIARKRSPTRRPSRARFRPDKSQNRSGDILPRRAGGSLEAETTLRSGSPSCKRVTAVDRIRPVPRTAFPLDQPDAHRQAPSMDRRDSKHHRSLTGPRGCGSRSRSAGSGKGSCPR